MIGSFWACVYLYSVCVCVWRKYTKSVYVLYWWGVPLFFFANSRLWSYACLRSEIYLYPHSLSSSRMPKQRTTRWRCGIYRRAWCADTQHTIRWVAKNMLQHRQIRASKVNVIKRWIIYRFLGLWTTTTNTNEKKNGQKICVIHILYDRRIGRRWSLMEK